MAVAECIFCRIVAGTSPCVELYRDATTFAFMDIHPVNEGHCLVTCLPLWHSLVCWWRSRPEHQIRK
jgi:histidine triad (HIT) family protein